MFFNASLKSSRWLESSLYPYSSSSALVYTCTLSSSPLSMAFLLHKAKIRLPAEAKAQASSKSSGVLYRFIAKTTTSSGRNSGKSSFIMLSVASQELSSLLIDSFSS